MKEKKQNYSKESQLKMEFSSTVNKQVNVIQCENVETGKVIRLSDSNINKSKVDYSGLVLKYTKSF